MTPLAFNALRFTGASSIVVILTWLVEHDLTIQREHWAKILVLGFMSNFVYQGFFILGIARTRAGNSSLILSTTPIFVALLGTLLRAENLQRRNWLGILLSFLGILLLVTAGGQLAMGRQTLTGDLLTLGAPAAWALYTVLAKGLIDRNSVLKATAWMMASSTPLMVLVALPELRRQDWQDISMGSWLGLAYSAILAIGIGYVIWNTGVKRLGSARTAVYSYLTPLITVIASWTFLGERMVPLQALGGVCILMGVALARHTSRG
jgi:drug/metabolite transporter (DMT)-like permease